MKIDLDHRKKYLLACSFGPDSMALFSLLKQQNYHFEVAHVNYNMRPESSMEKQNLVSFCRENEIKVHTIDVHFTQLKGNFQAWAREVRYQFFKQTLIENQLDVLLTGHHQDDVIETYFMQKQSKRDLDYFGIRRVTHIKEMIVIRPLLEFTKPALLEYCLTNSVPFSIDQSNLLPKYTRNKIRLTTLSQMSLETRQVILEEIKARNVLSQQLNARLLTLFTDFKKIKIAEFQRLEKQEKERLIFLMLQELGKAEFYTRAIFNRVTSVLDGNKACTLLSLNDTTYFSVFYGNFTFLDKNKYLKYEAKIEFGIKRFENSIVDYDVQELIEKLGLKYEDFPLTIRTYQSGDCYQIKDYCKKVNRLYVDMKMPKHIRLIWPVLLSKQERIIFIPRYRMNYVEKEKSKLRVLL